MDTMFGLKLASTPKPALPIIANSGHLARSPLLVIRASNGRITNRLTQNTTSKHALIHNIVTPNDPMPYRAPPNRSITLPNYRSQLTSPFYLSLQGILVTMALLGRGAG